jgi:wyosine [tRNA(Phe)-imidazoG37] synthetase (radical SAM superfamily)
MRPELPVAVLTNGSLFSDPGVRLELQQADVVLPSLDAATEEAFRRINRPRKNFTVGEHIEGLIRFREEFRGKFWLEVLILPGYNDEPANLLALKEAIASIAPDRVQLNTLRAATRSELEQIARQWAPLEVEIIAPAAERHRAAAYRTDTEAAILETLSRRPCTLGDMEKILGIHPNEINKYLGVLQEAGRIETSRQERGIFYQVRKLQNE